MTDTAPLKVCHCGRPVTGNGDDWQDTVMVDYCNHCRSVRCDAFPGACRRPQEAATRP